MSGIQAEKTPPATAPEGMAGTLTAGPKDWLRDWGGPDEKTHLAGCHRLVSPVETLARITPLLPAMGITRIANLTGLDRIGLPVTMVCRPNARSLAVSQGKGLSEAAAKVSGVMETIELYHAEHIEHPLKLASLRDLARGHEVVDLARLPRISDRFHPDLALLWIEGRDLFTGRPRWLPYESVHVNFTGPALPGAGCFEASSNGLASGNGMIEAICHAICELVERDSTALWHLRGAEGRALCGLDQASVTDPDCREVLARFATAGMAVSIWETSSDTGIPAFFCLITDQRDPLGHRGIGAGCHALPGIALMRALTEAAQVRMTYISGARDDLTPTDYLPEAQAEKAAQARVWQDQHRPSRRFDQITGQFSTHFTGDLGWLLTRLAAVGITEAVAVDLRRHEFGLNVVRVVIPGLEGLDDHPAYHPGVRAQNLRAALT